MHRGPAAYVLGPPPSRSRDLELEGGVNACHVDYVYEPQDSHVRGTELVFAFFLLFLFLLFLLFYCKKKKKKKSNGVVEISLLPVRSGTGETSI